MIRDEDVREKTLHTIRLPGPPKCQARETRENASEVDNFHRRINYVCTVRQVAEHCRNIEDDENIPGTRYRSATCTIKRTTDCRYY